MKQPYGKNNWVICGSYTSCLKTLSALLKKKNTLDNSNALLPLSKSSI